MDEIIKGVVIKAVKIERLALDFFETNIAKG